MTKIKPLLLMTISAISFKTSCIASSNYTIATEITNEVPPSGSTHSLAENFLLGTMVPPPPTMVLAPPAPHNFPTEHGTLSPEHQIYHVVGTPLNVDPQLVIERTRPRQLGPCTQKKPSDLAPRINIDFNELFQNSQAIFPSQPYQGPHAVLPPAYVPGYQYAEPSQQFKQPSYKQAQNYQHAASSSQHDEQLHARLPQAYTPNSHDEVPQFKQPPRFQDVAPLIQFERQPQDHGPYRQAQNYQYAAPSHQPYQGQPADLPPAYVPGYQYAEPSQQFKQPSRAHAFHRQAQNYQYAAPSYSQKGSAPLPAPYRASFLPDYVPLPKQGITPPPTREAVPLSRFHDAPGLHIYAPFKTASSELNTDDIQQQAPQSHAMSTESMLSKPVKGQAAREAYASTKNGYYLSSTRQKITLAQTGKPKRYNYKELSQDNIPSLHITSIEYTQESTQEAAIRLATRIGTKIGTLNYGNGTYTGGSAFNGLNGQEESFIRTTTLFSSLSQLVASQIDLEKEITKPFTHIRYNTDTNKALTEHNGVLISPNVSIFRRFNAQTTKYENLDTPTIVTVVTSVALNLTHGKPKDYAEITRQKIYSQLAAFAKEGLDSIVLGAWGCGTFGNKAEDIAPIYKSLLENQFKGAFKTVVFAIPRSNLLNIFKSILNAKGA